MTIPAEPHIGTVQLSEPQFSPERAGKIDVIRGMVHHAPGGVVTKIFHESLPSDQSASSVIRSGEFSHDGFVPAGETLELVREVLDSSKVREIRDLTHITPQHVSATDLFHVVTGRGVQISTPVLGRVAEEQGAPVEEMQRLSNIRADALLAGLYAAGANSRLVRKEAATRNKEVTVKYPRENGQVYALRMGIDTANELARQAEDALITATGKL